MKLTNKIFLTALSTFTFSAFGGVVSEVEDNNSLILANGIGMFDVPGGTAVIDGSITLGDVDWFEFETANLATLSFFAAFGVEGDGVMQIVSAGGDVIAFDDDSGIGLLPLIQITDLAAGTYYIGFSGFGDVDSSSVTSDELADGLGHSQEFSYKISVGYSIVPTPGAMALLGMGGVLTIRRRRA